MPLRFELGPVDISQISACHEAESYTTLGPSPLAWEPGTRIATTGVACQAFRSLRSVS